LDAIFFISMEYTWISNIDKNQTAVCFVTKQALGFK